MRVDLLADALVLALSAFLIQGTLLGLIAGVGRRMAGPARPLTGHAIGVVSLLAMLGIFLSTFALTLLPLGSENPPEGAAIVALAPGIAAWSMPSPSGSLSALLAGAWILGESVLIARALIGWWTLLGWRRAASSAVPDEWRAIVARLSRVLGIGRTVALKISDRIDVPVVAGMFRPVVLIPAGLERRMRDLDIESLLAHELAHVARGDLIVLVLQRIVETLFFFHPAVWWVSRRVTADRELCTDDLAVTTVGDRLTYARALARLEATRAPSFTPLLASSGGSLMSRIERLAARQAASRHPGRDVSAGRILTGTAIACALVVGSWFATPWAAEVGIKWLPEKVARYTPLFEAAGAEHGVDPDLLAIMALVESGGNPDARSSLGAVGLMQVMPSTARMIAEARGLQLDESQFADPQVNVDLAAWYVARAQRQFAAKDPDLQVALVAAAYNGGVPGLRKHMTSGAPLSDETQRYREMVLKLWQGRNDSVSPLSR